MVDSVFGIEHRAVGILQAARRDSAEQGVAAAQWQQWVARTFMMQLGSMTW